MNIFIWQANRHVATAFLVCPGNTPCRIQMQQIRRLGSTPRRPRHATPRHATNSGFPNATRNVVGTGVTTSSPSLTRKKEIHSGSGRPRERDKHKRIVPHPPHLTTGLAGRRQLLPARFIPSRRRAAPPVLRKQVITPLLILNQLID
jgi:hypothetical protein